MYSIKLKAEIGHAVSLNSQKLSTSELERYFSKEDLESGAYSDYVKQIYRDPEFEINYATAKSLNLFETDSNPIVVWFQEGELNKFVDLKLEAPHLTPIFNKEKFLKYWQKNKFFTQSKLVLKKKEGLKKEGLKKEVASKAKQAKLDKQIEEFEAKRLKLANFFKDDEALSLFKSEKLEAEFDNRLEVLTRAHLGSNYGLVLQTDDCSYNEKLAPSKAVKKKIALIEELRTDKWVESVEFQGYFSAEEKTDLHFVVDTCISRFELEFTI